MLGVKRLDRIQAALMLLCAFDAAFFLYYLFAYSIHTRSTISDTLFTRPEYAAVLSALLAARLTGGVLYLLRFRYKWGELQSGALGGIAVAIAGWGVLATHREMVGHFVGVGMFTIGSFAYSMIFVRLAATHARDAEGELVRTVLEAFLLMSTLALFTSFVVLWVDGEIDDGHGRNQAYVVEHAAYLTHLLFYTVFFLYHSPDPEKVYYSNQGGESGYYGETGRDVPMVCRPLILSPGCRLPVIMEVGQA